MKKALVVVALVLSLYGGSNILAEKLFPSSKTYTFCKGSDAICQNPGSAGMKCGSEEGCKCTYYFLVGVYCTRETQPN